MLLRLAMVLTLVLCATARADAGDPPDCTRDPAGEVTVRPGATVSVTFRCTDPQGAPMTAKLGAPPDRGTATVVPGAAPGTFVVTYTAPADAVQDDIADVGIEVTGSAPYPAYPAFTVVVTLPPPPPTCVEPDRDYVPAGEIDRVRAQCWNENDVGDTLVEIVTPPAHGAVTLDPYGMFTYIPAPGFRGEDAFSYRATNASGTSATVTQRIEVAPPIPQALRPARDATAKLCAPARAGEQCGPGYGRRTPGGGDKVSHRHWPRITGILWKVLDAGDHAHRGGPLADELLGHHGSDTIDGGGGTDVIWGDWDPYNNGTAQRDVLSGGAGNDLIYSSHGRNTIRGGAGADRIWAFYGHGTIDCGPGIDTVRLRGGSKAYKLRGCERRGTF